MIFGIDKIDPERLAVLAPDGTKLTYKDLVRAAGEVAEAIPERGLSFCLCANRPGALAGYLALAESGCVPLLLDEELHPDSFGSLFDTYGPAYLWLPVDMAEAVLASERESGTEPSASAEPAGTAGDRGEDLLRGRLKKKLYETCGYGLYSTGCLPYPMAPELCLLLATSGSTGNPKLVRLSRENLESNAQSIREYLQIDEAERPITTMPMQYTYGLSIINSHLTAGACILMTTDGYVQLPFWQFFNEQKATSFGGVPYTYELMNRLRLFRGPMPGLHYLTQAGGKLSPKMQEEIGTWAEKNGYRFYVMYGQTEASPRMAYLPPQMCLKKPGSMGIPIPGGRFEIVDSEGNVITQPHQSGELVYIGPNVSLGYAQQKEDLALGDENHGRLMTGDIAETDEDGYYYIVGRKKRFVKIFGVRVGLDACERLLQERYPDSQIFCGGEDNHLKIYSTDPEVVRDGAKVLAGILQQNEKGFSSLYLREIPRNEYGKVQLKKLDDCVGELPQVSGSTES